MSSRSIALAVLLCAIPLSLLASPAGAEDPAPPSSPSEFSGRFDPSTTRVNLQWTTSETAPLAYRVYRETAPLGQTQERSYSDRPPLDALYVYVLTAQDADGRVSAPVATAIPMPGCEVVSLTTSWNYPYLAVHVHEECIGGAKHDRDFTWTAGSA